MILTSTNEELALDALREIYEMAAWHADDDADADDVSPDDTCAHINGLIRQVCQRVLKS